MKTSVVPLKSQHRNIRGDAKMKTISIEDFPPDVQKDVYEIIATALLRAQKNGTYQPIEAASGE